MSIRIKTYPYGPLGSNMYALISEDSYIIVDPSVSPDRVELSGSPEAIFITHGHYDHFAALHEWNRMYPEAPVIIHSLDKMRLSTPSENCSAAFGMPFSADVSPIDAESVSGRAFLGGRVTLEVIHTPGHSEGEVLYIFSEEGERHMFSGDMLFRGSIGRDDLPGGDTAKMRASIELIKGLKGDYIIYPGHGPASRLSIERQYNPFF